MKRFVLVFSLAAVPCLALDAKFASLLKAVENRYNHAQTLEAQFSETFSAQGRTRKPETGVLYLRKPARMRWEYSSPPGKLFVSDGKYLYLYTPAENRVQQMKPKETEDMRAPLAFLLGKLSFEKEFTNFEWRPEDSQTWISAEPKSANLPYSKVEFVIGPDFRIRRVKVTGQDFSVLDFLFEGEKLNPPLDAALFQFRRPPGAELVEVTRQ